MGRSAVSAAVTLVLVIGVGCKKTVSPETSTTTGLKEPACHLEEYEKLKLQGIPHRSPCHCFHGSISEVVGTVAQCACHKGWGGQRCDVCVDLQVCLPGARVDTAVETLLASQASASVQPSQGALIRTREFVEAMLRADSVVVAAVKSVKKVFRPTMTPTYQERFTLADLDIQEVVRGSTISAARLTFSGPADWADPGFASESPHIHSGAFRLYALRLRPGWTHLVPGASDWRLTDDEQINLGFYQVPLAKVRKALKAPASLTKSAPSLTEESDED